MITKPNFLSIMRIKQLVPRMLLVVGLAAIMSAIGPGRVLSGPTDSLEKAKSITEFHTEPILDGKGEVVGTKTTTSRGFSSTDTETYTAGPYAGSIISHTHDATGQRTSTTIKNPDGSGSTEKVDGKNDVVTVTDKNGQLVSTTTTTPDGKGGSTSVTKDKNGKVVSTTTTGPDGNVVSQTGKNKKFSDTEAQSTGGTQTSQGSGKQKDKHKFATEVFHQNKEKSNVQDSGSSSASSGSSGQSHHHGKR